jgi:hypothetical protein
MPVRSISGAVGRAEDQWYDCHFIDAMGMNFIRSQVRYVWECLNVYCCRKYRWLIHSVPSNE